MVWGKFDDGYPENRKTRQLTDAEYRLDSSGILWSCKYLTDGRISDEDLALIPGIRVPRQTVDGVVRKGRWHTPGHVCDSSYCYPIDSGWLIHDFHEFNPTAADVKDKQRKRREAGSKGGKSSSARRANLRAVGEANA